LRSPIGRGIVWTLALLVCAVSGYASFLLAKLHYRPAAPEGLFMQVCSAFATSSCEKVSKSPWSWFPPMPSEDELQVEADRGSSSEQVGGDDQARKGAMEIARDKEKLREKAAESRIPVAQLGLSWFICAFCWLLFTGPRPASRRWMHLVFVLVAGLGVLVSVVFEIIMWTQLDAWCPWCVVTHAGSLLVFVFALLLIPSREAEPEVMPLPSAVATGEPSGSLFAPAPAAGWAPEPEGWPTTRVALMTGAVAVCLLGLFGAYLRNYALQSKAESASFYQAIFMKKLQQYDRYWQHRYWAWTLCPRVEIPVKDRPVLGSSAAPHTMVVFSDFECPQCAKFEKFFRDKIAPVAANMPNGGLKVVFKHWPICKDCNTLMEGRTLHPAACEAACAAEAARLLGGDKAFWQMHDLLFETQPQWTKSRNFVPYANQLGLDPQKFLAAMKSDEAMSRVKADIADGVNLGADLSPVLRPETKVESTPTIFIDGRRFNSPGYDNIAAWIYILQMPQPLTLKPLPLPATRPAPAGQGASGPRLGPTLDAAREARRPSVPAASGPAGTGR
jgi:protein-disulfide isomerase/uncharacterized membrane protein